METTGARWGRGAAGGVDLLPALLPRETGVRETAGRGHTVRAGHSLFISSFALRSFHIHGSLSL